MELPYSLPFVQTIPAVPISASAAGGPVREAEPRPARFPKQLRDVRRVMADGCWRSLQELADASGWPAASVSARLRDLRKIGHTVHRRRRFIGGCLSRLWEYQVVSNV